MGSHDLVVVGDQLVDVVQVHLVHGGAGGGFWVSVTDLAPRKTRSERREGTCAETSSLIGSGEDKTAPPTNKNQSAANAGNHVRGVCLLLAGCSVSSFLRPIRVSPSVLPELDNSFTAGCCESRGEDSRRFPLLPVQWGRS